MCMFSLSWNTYGFSAPCHAAGGPSGVPLLADSGWLLYSCSDGFAWGWGLSCTNCPVPPLFSFFVPVQLPLPLLPLRGSAPLPSGLACLSPVCWSTLKFGWRGLAATFSSVPVRCFPCCRYVGIFWASPAPLACWGSWGFAPCVMVFLLRCCLLGLQVGFPCCLFLTLEWVYFWLRCLQSLWATKAVSAALRGSSSSSCVCWSITFFWSWGGFSSRVGGSSCDSWFWSLLMLGHTFLTPSPLPLLPSLAVGWSWRLFFLALCLGFVLLASRVGCWLVVIEVFP